MSVSFQQVIPILRIFSLERAKEFYVGFLGMEVRWEHRFEPDAPVYLEIARGGLVLHLSEHHGDASPGATVFVRMRGLRELHAEIIAKRYSFMRPGIEPAAWGGEVMELTDPFANRLRLAEAPP